MRIHEGASGMPRGRRVVLSVVLEREGNLVMEASAPSFLKTNSAVIPTGAPPECFFHRRFMARSGGIPKVSHVPLPHQGVLTTPLAVTGWRKRGVSLWAHLLFPLPACRRTAGGRNNGWEELPVAVSAGTMRRGPSTPRQKPTMEKAFLWRSG